jgi:hypothetical protein
MPEATQVQIRAAFTSLMTQRLTSARLVSHVRNSHGVALDALAEPWRTLAATALNTDAAAVANQLTGQVPAAEQQAWEGFQQVANLLTGDDVTNANYAPGSGDATADYLFKQFVSTTTLWTQDLPAAAQGLLNRTADMLTVVSQRTTQVNNVKATLTDERNRLQQGIQAVQGRRAESHQDAVLGVLAPVIVDLDAAIASAQGAFVDCTVDAYTQKIAQLAGPLAAVTGEVVVNAGWPLVGRCRAEQTALIRLADAVSAAALAETRKVLAGNPARSRYNDFIGWYGAAGYYAFVGRDAAAQAAILERIHLSGAVTLTLHTAVPQMSCDASVLKPYLTAIASTAVETNALCTAIQQVQHVQITLPAGVNANGWVAINDIRFPRGFSHAQISSDQACLKHARQEVGDGANQQRLTAYFAELFLACQAARTGWLAANRPSPHLVTTQQARATWNIMVRDRNGGPEVFHVDSGYEKSPWRN